jgi:hypothetical protein
MFNALAFGSQIDEAEARGALTQMQAEEIRRRLPFVAAQQLSELGLRDAQTGLISVQSQDIINTTQSRLRELQSRGLLNETNAARLYEEIQTVVPLAQAQINFTQAQADHINRQISAIYRKYLADAGLTEAQIQTELALLPHIGPQAAATTNLITQQAKQIEEEIPFINPLRTSEIELNKVRAQNIQAQTGLTNAQTNDLMARMEFIRPLSEAEIRQRIASGQFSEAQARTENRIRERRMEEFISQNNLREAQAALFREQVRQLSTTVNVEIDGIKYPVQIGNIDTTVNTILRNRGLQQQRERTSRRLEGAQNLQQQNVRRDMQKEADNARGLLVQQDNRVYKIPPEEIATYADIYNRNAAISNSLLIPTQRSGWIGAPYTGLVEVTIPKTGNRQLTGAELTEYARSKGYNPSTDMERFLKEFFFPQLKLKYENYIKPVR